MSDLIRQNLTRDDLLLIVDAKDAEIATLRMVVAELLHTTRLKEPSGGWLEARARAVRVLNGGPPGSRTVSLAKSCADGTGTQPAIIAALGGAA